MRVNLDELHAHVWEHLHSMDLYACETTVETTIKTTLEFLVPHIKAGEEEACRMGCEVTMKMMMGIGE